MPPPIPSRLRVVHVLVRLPGSGTERQLAGMLRAAAGVHWDPTLAVLVPGSPLAAELRADGVDVVELGVGSAADPRGLAALRRLLARRRADVVHGSLWGGNVVARVAAAGPRRPAVVCSERRVEDFRAAPARALDRALRPLADAWIGNSDDVGAFITRAHGVTARRVTVVRNGIDRTVFSPPATPRPPRARPRIGALGRLVHQKGFDVLLAALPAVLAQRDVEVVVHGDGEQRAALEAAADGLPVTFAGYLATPEAVADFLRGLDLFVMPSRYEGLPNAVLEAVACGAPVVATDVPGMAEAVGTGTMLVPAEDPAALAHGILAALAGGGTAPPARPVASFNDVAVAHLGVFRTALRRRPAGALSRGAAHSLDSAP